MSKKYCNEDDTSISRGSRTVGYSTQDVRFGFVTYTQKNTGLYNKDRIQNKDSNLPSGYFPNKGGTNKSICYYNKDNTQISKQYSNKNCNQISKQYSNTNVTQLRNQGACVEFFTHPKLSKRYSVQHGSSEFSTKTSNEHPSHATYKVHQRQNNYIVKNRYARGPDGTIGFNVNRKITVDKFILKN